MAKVKEWKDGSGDTFAVTFDQDTQEAVFSSMPNYGSERDYVVKVCISDGKDYFGILVRQGASDTNWKSHAVLMGFGIEGAVGFGHLEGVDLRCVVFLDKDGNPSVIRFKSIEDEECN